MEPLVAPYTVDISKPLQPVMLQPMLVCQDQLANRIVVNLVDGDAPVAITGTVTGKALRADGNTVPLVNGSSAGGSMSVDLPEAAYAIEGRVIISLSVATPQNKVTLFVGVGNVIKTESGSYVDPGEVISDIDDLIAVIDTAVASIPADYSDLLATIAPNYEDLTFPVSAGQWCWYSGVLYAANQDISTSENWTAAHWTAVTVGGEAAALKSAINSLDAVVFEVGKNLFDKDSADIVPGKYVQDDNGIEKSNGDNQYYDYIIIPCEPNTNYALNQNYALVAFYSGTPNTTSGANYISGVRFASAKSFTTPATAVYMAVSYNVNYVSTFQVEKGTESTSYEPYQEGINGANILPATIDASKLSFSIQTDTTLSVSGKPADAKATGDKFAEVLTDIDNLNDAIEVLDKVGKNLFNKDDTSIVDGKYVAYNDGKAYPNSSFSYIIMSCKTNTQYAINKNYCHVAFYSDTPNVLTGANYIDGVTGADAKSFTTPATAIYMILSYGTANADSLQVEYGSESTAYEPYQHGLDGTIILDGTVGIDKLAFTLEQPIINTIIVDANGNGDFATLRSALESIQDSSEMHQYVVEILPGTYDISTEYTAEEWAVEDASFVGLMVPDWTTLIGIGNKENVVITASSLTQRTYVSTLNLANTCALKNLTVSATNLRYVIHDDYATAGQNKYVRTLENCDFIGTDLKLIYVYGCGLKQGAEFHVKNCTFTTNLASNFCFLMHNNTNWSRNAFIEIENCRFEPYATSYGCLFASMSNGAKLTYVTLKGNKMKKLRLNENNASAYGAGIVFKVSGYANVIDSTDIINTDGQDYSSYISLI